jgi:glycerol-3-phosphate dehydrogenase (NAD(P)+)
MGSEVAVGVLGAGSWGTALAVLLARNGHRSLLWGRDRASMERLRQRGANDVYLPGIPFPPGLEVHHHLATVLGQARDVLVVVPSAAFRGVLGQVAPRLATGQGLAWATKGLDPETSCLLHEVAAATLAGGTPTGVLSGPTFAAEVARGLPTAVTFASSNPEFAARLSGLLHSETFRVYTSDDVIGVELGGAVKNVLAVAAGIADGLGLGANTRAALITRGLAEMMRLGVALGGRRETFMGLTGLGDLVLTCTENLSRNRRLGLALAGNEALEEALRRIGQVVEGVRTAREVMTLAAQHGVEMPISAQVQRVLYEGVAPREAVQTLLHRGQKPEGP